MANAKNLNNIEPKQLMIKEIKLIKVRFIDILSQVLMGRAMLQRRRLSHISVTLESKGN